MKFSHKLFFLGLFLASSSYSNELQATYAKKLCATAFHESETIKGCEGFVDFHKDYLNSYSRYNAAVFVCQFGSANDYQKGWDCFLKANKMLSPQSQLNLKSCDRGRYYQKFDCAFKIFKNKG